MVRNLLSLLAARQNNILSGASILMVAVFASKFLGLIRDRLLVHNFDTAHAAIFFAAFKLPDLLFQLLIFGALSVAFIPIFTDYLSHQGEDEAFDFASNILNLSLLVFGLVVIVAFIFTPLLNSLLVPGFNGPQKEMTDQLTRIILFSQVILVIGSFFIAIAQSYQRFIISSLAPLFYNLGIIFGIAVLSRWFGIMGPALGVVLGAILHFVIQLPLLKSLGYKYHLSFNFLNAGVKEIFKLMSVRNIGLVAEQFNDAVGIALASLVSYSSVTILTFAQHLQVVPIGLFGATIAQAALPILAREQSKSEGAAFKITLLTTLHQILFLTLPATAMLIVLRIPIVRLVFGASQFNWDDTVLTGLTVGYLSLGLAAQSATLLLVRGFYALKDTKTPVMVSIMTVIINVSLSFWFVRVLHLPVWAVGLAYSVAAIFSLILMLTFLDKKVGGFDKKALLNPALKMLLAAIVAAVALYIPIKALDQLVFDTTKTMNLLVLTGIASLFGLGVYGILVWLMDVKELETYANLIKKLGHMQSQIKPQELLSEESGPA